MWTHSRGRRRRKSFLLWHCSAAGTGAERLTYYTVATARTDARVSPTVSSSHCSSMTAVLELDGYSCIYSLPLQLGKESSDLPSPIQGFDQHWCLCCVCMLCSSSLLLPLAIVCVVRQRLSGRPYSARLVSGRLTWADDPAWANTVAPRPKPKMNYHLQISIGISSVPNLLGWQLPDHGSVISHCWSLW